MKGFIVRVIFSFLILITSPFVLTLQFLWWLFTGKTNKKVDKFMNYTCSKF